MNNRRLKRYSTILDYQNQQVSVANYFGGEPGSMSPSSVLDRRRSEDSEAWRLRIENSLAEPICWLDSINDVPAALNDPTGMEPRGTELLGSEPRGTELDGEGIGISIGRELRVSDVPSIPAAVGETGAAPPRPPPPSPSPPSKSESESPPSPLPPRPLRRLLLPLLPAEPPFPPRNLPDSESSNANMPYSSSDSDPDPDAAAPPSASSAEENSLS